MKLHQRFTLINLCNLRSRETRLLLYANTIVLSKANNFRYRAIYDREIGTIQETGRVVTDIDDSPGSPSAGARVVDRGIVSKKQGTKH